MESQISTIQCEATHFADLISLGRTYYPAGHHALTEKFLKWLYLDNPYGAATLVVASEGKLWVGLIALIPVMLECNGVKQTACYAVNVLTHPEHRSKNLFVKMIKYAREALSQNNVWLIGHPNSNAVPGWKRQKMNFMNPLHLYLSKLGLFGVRRIHSLEQLCDLPESFWNSLKERADMHVAYTPEYIAWRFLNAPHRKYEVSAVYSGGALIGLRVTRRFKGPVDLMLDAIAPIAKFGDVLASVRWPTLVMHSGSGVLASEIERGCWRLPVNRVFPFFVTTWNNVPATDSMSGVSLTASDF